MKINSVQVNSSGIVTAGPFAGWEYLAAEPFDSHVGPFFHRKLEDGTVLCAFRAETKNTNGLGIVHGGCLLTLADYCMFVTAITKTDGDEVVTVSICSGSWGRREPAN